MSNVLAHSGAQASAGLVRGAIPPGTPGRAIVVRDTEDGKYRLYIDQPGLGFQPLDPNVASPPYYPALAAEGATVVDTTYPYGDVRRFGAVLGKQADDAAMTAASAVLTSALSLFAVDDIGKPITVVGAGVAGAALITTIASYQGPGQVTLAAAAGTTITGEYASWGVDSLFAFNALEAWMSNPLNTAATGVFGFPATAGPGSYYLSGRWVTSKAYDVYMPGVTLSHALEITGHPRKFVGPAVAGSPEEGYYYKRSQGSTYSGHRAVGCNGDGFLFGKQGSATQLAYGLWVKPHASQNLGNGFKFYGDDADTSWVNAITLDTPSARSNALAGYSFGGSNVGYNTMINVHAEGNGTYSMEGTADQLWIFGGHLVDHVGDVAVNIVGGGNTMDGGRVYGDPELGALTGFVAYKTSFTIAGFRVRLDNTGGRVTVGNDILFTNAAKIRATTGGPEGNQTSAPGGLFLREDSTVGAMGTAWVKESGTGNTGWRRLAIHWASGTTGNRPAPGAGINIGSQYWDTTLGKPVWWNGSVWKDATGATV
jgi:hypothetical protein